MLRSLYPRAYRRYLSLPLLGSIADGLDDWLASNGHTELSRKNTICELRHVDAELRRHRIKEIPLLSKIYGLILAREVVQACDRVPFPWHRRYGIRRIV